MSEDEPEGPQPPDERLEHLADVPDGAGCTEIWDHLSDRRERSED